MGIIVDGGPSGPPFSCEGTDLTDKAAAFIDAAFLEKEGSKALGVSKRDRRTNAAAVVEWLRKSYSRHSFEASEQYAWANQVPAWRGSKLLRAYWYDGAFDPGHPSAAAQRRYFEAIGRTPGVQLRLGNVAKRRSRFKTPIRRAIADATREMGVDPAELLTKFDARWEFRPVMQQKGVDTLLALDLVKLAGRGAIDTAILVSGDRDFAEAIRAAQDFDIEVLVATPRLDSVARDVAIIADGIIEMTEKDLQQILPPQSGTRPSGHDTRHRQQRPKPTIPRSLGNVQPWIR